MKSADQFLCYLFVTNLNLSLQMGKGFWFYENLDL
jgi:hypothetical protein